ALIDDSCRNLEIVCHSIRQPVEELSGGNQQKVVLARWLASNPDILLLDEPTRGIDVATRQRIHQLLDSLAESGKTLVVVSSDMEELLAVCDRILVMSNGRLTGEFAGPDWNEHAIMGAAFAGYSGERELHG
ncbi:MAG: sugar ABC transporter ATP-binding protein, partial [Planctomycetaceae bacterium]|nr:sugar ABC transporter ATP-binding protein [Planctomycetaceae bacterium]